MSHVYQLHQTDGLTEAQASTCTIMREWASAVCEREYTRLAKSDMRSHSPVERHVVIRTFDTVFAVVASKTEDTQNI